MSEIVIRAARSEDKGAWLKLWQGYCQFYKEALAEHITEHTWSQIVAQRSAIRSLVAVTPDGKLLGFANYVLHPHTWSSDLVCYLEDLYVDPDNRKSGVGRALIDYLLQTASINKWARVYWMTETDNESARKLYDHYVKADGFVRYVVKIDPDLLFV